MDSILPGSSVHGILQARILEWVAISFSKSHKTNYFLNANILDRISVLCWSRKWQPIPVFLPGEFHGQRNLAGYSPWGCRESDMNEGDLAQCTVLYLS